MPESTVSLLKKAVESQAKALDKPKADRRELQEEQTANDMRKGEK